VSVSGVRIHYSDFIVSTSRMHTYDALNRLSWRLDPLNGTTGFTYDANGNLLSVTDARRSTDEGSENSLRCLFGVRWPISWNVLQWKTELFGLFPLSLASFC
jgi:YD repeat-containing protein